MKGEAFSGVNRRKHLVHFYELLSSLQQESGIRYLRDCNGRMAWPERGVYFFFEAGEQRSDSGSGTRVVRVGTHALKEGSQTTLWNRLSQHHGAVKTGGGNHRGSIFRLIVGTSLVTKGESPGIDTWGKGSTAPREVRAHEQELERLVSQTIGSMPFLWIGIDDPSGPDSMRGYVERNSIALLSNSGKDALDSPSEHWLGRFCDRERVRKSGLWNSNHVDESYDPAFLDKFAELIG